MSTATAFDHKTALIDRLRDTCKTYLADLGYIPADKLNAVPMGKARPPLEFTAECAGFNKFVASVLEGSPLTPKSPEERKEYYASVDTLEKATAELQGSIDRIIAGIEKSDEEALFAPTTTPWGSETTVYNLITMCASHMGYHCGQLNYIQALYGDDQSHWS